MNEKLITKFFKEKNILVTGGTGSIGSAIVKKLVEFSPETIRVFDISENSLFYLHETLKKYSNVRFLVGDIRDKNRLTRATENVDIIFNTAALKHVPLCEGNPFEAVRTNVNGTQNVIDVALERDVSQVMHISTDKVVNTTNTLGASKLLSEKLVMAAQNYIGHKKTIFSCVRFGNVLGSNGSLLQLIAKQLQQNEKPFITDENMSRFLLTEEKAVDFILNATVTQKGGKIFVPKMPSIMIKDLIKAIIEELSKIYLIESVSPEISGIRIGEKLYEEIMTEYEFERCEEQESMYIIPGELSSTKIIPKQKIELSSDKALKLSYQQVREIVLSTIMKNKKTLLTNEGIN